MKKDKQTTILVVDDEQVHRYMLSSMFKEWGWRCVEADDGLTAVEAVEKHSYDAVLMDVRMARMDGREAFGKIHAMNPSLPVIIMTAYSSVDDAVEAIKHGAYDYLTKPLDFDRLRLTLERAVDRHQVEEKRRDSDGTTSEFQSSIIGSSPPMQELLEMIIYVAPTEATVLVAGESGTGKELVAESLHNNSERKDGPFVKVNCAALVDSLLESELFGHEKGAFTGADRRREGKFVQADGGTLFLDEIGETSQAMQVKLLRVLQEQELQRVGGEQTLKVDVPQLVEHFVKIFVEKNRKSVASIAPDCMDLLSRYPWPGNVRELENAIERGVILMRGDQLSIKSLPLSIQKFDGAGEAKAKIGLPSSLHEAEKVMILKTLEETGGNKSEAARRLGITRKTLQNKLQKYDES